MLNVAPLLLGLWNQPGTFWKALDEGISKRFLVIVERPSFWRNEAQRVSFFTKSYETQPHVKKWRLGKWASKTISCLFNNISSIFHNLIRMAGILRTAVFLKSRPFSKFHPHYVGISTLSTINAKKQPFAKFQPFGWNSAKRRDCKKAAICKIPASLQKNVSRPPFP